MKRKLTEYVIKFLKNPKMIIPFFGDKGLFNWMPDEFYLKMIYQIKIDRKLNLEFPKTFNEKLQWLKLNDRKPEYTQMVDKYEVREFVKKTIGEEYLIPLIGVYENFEEINFDQLPNQFVLKCTNDSGGLVICKEKNKLDIKKSRKKINRCLKRNFYHMYREWPYKNVKPRIICEKYMSDESGIELKDYKFFCFNGTPKSLYVGSNRAIDTRFDFYDMEFKHIPLIQKYKNSENRIIKPKGFDEMVRLATKLAKNIPHVRVDFYDINGKVYFGELTFYHLSGLVKFEPKEYDEQFGIWLELPQI